MHPLNIMNCSFQEGNGLGLSMRKRGALTFNHISGNFVANDENIITYHGKEGKLISKH